MFHPVSKPVHVVLLAIVLNACAVMAHAQQPSAKAIETAKELIVVKGAGTLFGALVPGVVEKTKGMFLQSNPMLGKPLNEVAAKLRADFAAHGAEIVDEMAKLYAARFTEQELAEGLAFYKSPVGRKMLDEDPKILEATMKSAEALAQKLSLEIIDRMRAEMRKRGHEI